MPKRQRRLRDSGDSTQQSQTLDDDPTGTYRGTTSREAGFPGHPSSSTRKSRKSIASGKLNNNAKRSHPRRGEPSTKKAVVGSFQIPYPDGLTPPLTSTPETNGSSQMPVTIPDDSDIGDEQRTENPTTTSAGTSTKKDKRSVTLTAPGFEDVKTEPLTEDMMRRTMFLVTMHDSTIGPVPVPFTECGNFDVLFPRLSEEQGVPAEDVGKIDRITTVFNWTGGEFGGRVGGIRKNKPAH